MDDPNAAVSKSVKLGDINRDPNQTPDPSCRRFDDWQQKVTPTMSNPLKLSNRVQWRRQDIDPGGRRAACVCMEVTDRPTSQSER